jgi:tripartite-type tricarboxylate transporter receptor subunit TctC
VSRIRKWLFALLACVAAAAHAQGYPAKPVKIVVGFAPGGGTDVVARLLGQRMSVDLKQQFVVENKPGAGGAIAAEQVAKSPADGYTLLLTPTSHVINPSIYSHLPFDTQKDFAPISMVVSTPIMIAVATKVPVSTLNELVKYAKAHPGLNYGSAGNGTVFHLATEIFKRDNGIDLAHIPYKGGGPVVTALVAGEIDMAFETLLALQPHVRAGRAKALAIASAARSRNMPDVPSAVEEGFPSRVAANDYMMFAPAGTPRAVIDTLYNSLSAALHDPEIVDKIALQGADIVGSTPAELDAHVRRELARWSAAAKQANVKAD